MASKQIQRVASLAFKTFSAGSNAFGNSYCEQLSQLKAEVNDIRAEDLNFDITLVSDTREPSDLESEGRSTGTCSTETRGRSRRSEAPVTYLDLWEDDVFTMGVFVISSGFTMPLHDHPEMCGMIKVIHGSMNVTSYSVIPHATSIPIPEALVEGSTTPMPAWQKSLIQCVKRLPDVLITPASEPCVLSSTEGNFHQLQAVGGPAAFLDILAPPYDHTFGTRKCHYYKDVTPQRVGSSNIHYLMRIGQPKEFWCKSATYLGPKIDPYT